MYYLTVTSVLGFRPKYKEEATCVVYGQYNLKTAPCINVCYKKSLSNEGIFKNGLFGALFK